jgi:hypothetical protein
MMGKIAKRQTLVPANVSSQNLFRPEWLRTVDPACVSGLKRRSILQVSANDQDHHG